MSDHPSQPAAHDVNGNGAESSAQMDPALHQRLRAVTMDFNHRELAELTGVSLETSRRYSEGRGPSLAYIKRLCDALGISADWLLLGRGQPVYRPGVPIGQMDSSVDEVLDGLSRYLKRLHLELARAGANLQGASTQGGAAGELKVAEHEFVDPFAGQERGAVPPPPAAPARDTPQVQVRLVLGPANGCQLTLPANAPGEIHVVLDDRRTPSLEAGPTAASQPYRRVFDRVYRWIGSPRTP